MTVQMATILHPSLYPHPLQCGFAVPPIKKWIQLPSPLESRLAHDLLWPRGYSGSDGVLGPGPPLQWHCVLPCFLLEPCSCHMNKLELACWRVSELRLITRQPHTCERAQPRPQSRTPNHSRPQMRWDECP